MRSETVAADRDLMRVAEMSEAQAYVNWINSAPEELKLDYRAYAGKLGDSTIVFTIPKIDWYTPNRVMGFGLFEPANAGMLDEVLKLSRERGVFRFFVPLCPQTEPSHEVLRDLLLGYGFRLHNTWVKLYRGAEPVSTEFKCKFDIRKIRPERSKDFAVTLLGGFGYPRSFEPWLELLVGKPGWHHYMAFAEERPVANAALFVRDKIGYLCLGSTLPSHRRMGGQEALIQKRIQDGIALGCERFFVETEEDTGEKPNPSFHNLLRFGFKFLYPRDNYVYDFTGPN